MEILNKKIILGITGSIATYKAPQLVRDLQKAGAEVRVVATKAAMEFVSRLVLENLTHYPVICDVFDEHFQQQGAWHIELAHWADMLLIAPCSATTLSKIATGNADNPVSCLALALPVNKQLVVAPAMDFTMYENAATQHNIGVIKERKGSIIEPAEGELASGLKGKGRLPDNAILLASVRSIFESANITCGSDSSKPLSGKRILITAGGTQERIDDVRFISNYSTGKMGFALAKAANELGASVTLVVGSVSAEVPVVDRLYNVVSAAEMFEVVKQNTAQDAIIMAAAVADYTPAEHFNGKMKKKESECTLKLKRTVDILAWLGANIDHSRTKLVGFALEADNHLENAKMKLEEKQCDFIVLNSVYGDNSGFGGGNNTITIVEKTGKTTEYSAMSKYECAKKVLECLYEQNL